VRVIDTAHLLELAPVDRALADFYGELVERTARDLDVDPATLRRWCEEKLITAGGTRAPAYKGKTETEGMSNAVVERLAAEHLLRGDSRAGGYWYELAHDKFVEPIRESNRRALEREVVDVSAFSNFVANANDRMLAAVDQLRTADDEGRRLALRQIEAALTTAAPLSKSVGDEVRAALRDVTADRTVPEGLRRDAETLLLAADDPELARSFLEDPLRTRPTLRSLRLRRIRWRELVLALVGLVVLLLFSVGALRGVTELAPWDTQTAGDVAMSLAAGIVTGVWTLAYALETLENFPLDSFRRSKSQIVHTLTAPFAPIAKRKGIFPAWPLNLIVPWVVGAAAGVGTAEAFDESPDVAFVLFVTGLTVGFAFAYRRET
jgi:hypothetical protein